ncbi:hypothetical protein EF888_16805 [Silicimonas algicola]|uniref:Uncharacterized protein n=1 Tax=Silicimonas algicola TaxID=1826607 RepID=A0A316G473_9RHOB|nr:hypothetical protein [Silicimonas algicola]AZQ68644.1 hypothetical protein EF888_16805 [Silicimonas algicola]PWK55628.1 hypothetical protein C8D95_10623 [Silicimonas algicola]
MTEVLCRCPQRGTPSHPRRGRVAGKSCESLSGRTDLPSIDQINIGFEPQGHEGFPVPHYDVHIYFIPAAEVAAIN